MVRVAEEVDFYVGGGDYQFGEGAISGLQLDFYRAGDHVLGNHYVEILFAGGGPIVFAGEDRVLIVEIVVQHDHVRIGELKIAEERVRCAGDGEGTLGGVVCESYGAARVLGRLRRPLVFHEPAVRGEMQFAGDFHFAAGGNLQVGGTFGDPGVAIGGDFKLLAADILSGERDAEAAFVT